MFPFPMFPAPPTLSMWQVVLIGLVAGIGIVIARRLREKLTEPKCDLKAMDIDVKNLEMQELCLKEIKPGIYVDEERKRYVIVPDIVERIKKKVGTGYEEFVITERITPRASIAVRAKTFADVGLAAAAETEEPISIDYGSVTEALKKLREKQQEKLAGEIKVGDVSLHVAIKPSPLLRELLGDAARTSLDVVKKMVDLIGDVDAAAKIIQARATYVEKIGMVVKGIIIALGILAILVAVASYLAGR